MAENKSEFVFASCQLVNVWAMKMSSEERVMFVTEVSYKLVSFNTQRFVTKLSC